MRDLKFVLNKEQKKVFESKSKLIIASRRGGLRAVLKILKKLGVKSPMELFKEDNNE